MNTLNFFVYDYPAKGNDSTFIEDEILLLSKIFKKVNIIPLKKNNFKSEYVKAKNINYDFSLNQEIYNLKNIHVKLINIIMCKIFWNELFSIKKKNKIKKIIMILKERFIAECICIWILKNKNENIDKNIFYSYWSNHTLLAFYFLKKQKKINNCFARTLGSDLNGFIPFDSFIPFKKYKFLNLDFILILNDGQKDKLINEMLINKDRIYKCYQGMKLQNFCTVNNTNKKIHILSCGALIHVKNTLKILEFVYLLKKILINYEITYTSIGYGYQIHQINKFIENKLKDVDVKIIKEIPNFFDYLKNNRVDLFINLSLSEGMSFATMEALSCSVPVVCSNIPGNLEIINNKNGYIVDISENESFKKIINEIKIDIETKRLIKKKIESRKCVSEKIERNKALNNMKEIIVKEYFN